MVCFGQSLAKSALVSSSFFKKMLRPPPLVPACFCPNAVERRSDVTFFEARKADKYN